MVWTGPRRPQIPVDSSSLVFLWTEQSQMVQHRPSIPHRWEQTQRHKNPLFWEEELSTLCYKLYPTKLEKLQYSKEPGLKFTLAATFITLDYKIASGLTVMYLSRFYANSDILPMLYMSSVISYIQFGKLLFSSGVPLSVPVSILNITLLPQVLHC